MKLHLYLLMLFLSASTALNAQKEGSIWPFGTNNAINFNTGSPQYGGIPGCGAATVRVMPSDRANAICDANGNLLFYVKMKDYHNPNQVNPPDHSWMNVYQANGQAMVNGYLGTSNFTSGPMQLIKKPGENQQYYIIYSLNYALLSTTVDMALNNGNGAIVAAEKGRMLSGWQTVVGEKTTVVQGCDCIWLVVRSREANEYKSFKITAAGISEQPVVSSVGLLPINNYNTTYLGPIGGFSLSLATGNGIDNFAGLLKSSPDRRSIIACCRGGLEWYTFNPCSGQLSEPRLLDTTVFYQACYPSPSCGDPCNDSVPVGFYSACFSPDNSKLYATYSYSRSVYQFDLSLPNIEAIRASKTAILSNRPTMAVCVLACDMLDTTGMGDLKRGPDGKIYIGNNTGLGCRVNANTSQFHALHVIHNPNVSGLACNPELEAVYLGPLGNSYFRTAVNLPADIVMPPAEQDTLSRFQTLLLCRGIEILADTPGYCYQWNTGASTAEIVPDTPGCYMVHWRGKDCRYHIDSFLISYPAMPQVQIKSPSCPGELAVSVLPKDTLVYSYVLQNEDSDNEQSYEVKGLFIFKELAPGKFSLLIRNSLGCDSLLYFTLATWPVPELMLLPEDTLLRYGDEIQLYASGALHYQWSPTAVLDQATSATPWARPFSPTVFQVIGTNEFGCRDTGYIRIRIDYRLPDLVPNAFSPNGDGINDMFGVSGITYQQVRYLKVFNRYGQLLFATVDSRKGWDGTYKGQACDAGTYYYQLELNYPDGLTRQLKGDVLLIR